MIKEALLFSELLTDDYKSVKIVNSSPSKSVFYDMESSIAPFDAVERVAIATMTEDDNTFLRITSAPNTGNKYAYAKLQTAEITRSSDTIIIDYDFRFGATRQYLSISDVSKRPGASMQSEVDYAGEIFRQGGNHLGQYCINGTPTDRMIITNEWLHLNAIVYRNKRIVQYAITKVSDNSHVLQGKVAFMDTSSVVTGLDYYTWDNDMTCDIDNIGITGSYQAVDDMLYAVKENNGYRLFTFRDGQEVTLTQNKYEEYSSIPTQVGVWVDGTPIWRVAFDREFTKADAPDIWLDKAFRIIDLIDVWKDYDLVRLFLNSEIEANTGFEAAPELNIIDNYACIHDNSYWWKLPKNVMLDDDTVLRIGGFVEFVTPASNIKTT